MVLQVIQALLKDNPLSKRLTVTHSAIGIIEIGINILPSGLPLDIAYIESVDDDSSKVMVYGWACVSCRAANPPITHILGGKELIIDLHDPDSLSIISEFIDSRAYAAIKAHTNLLMRTYAWGLYKYSQIMRRIQKV